MPTPASQPEEQRLPSPGPRESVSCLLSRGSGVSVPAEFCARSSGPTWTHSGSGAWTLFVRQTPPPDAPAQTRQLCASQSGSATSVVIRLAVTFVAPLNEITPGSRPYFFGPYRRHFGPSARKLREFLARSALRKRASRLAIRRNVAFARATIAGEMALAGYVRAADL